MEKSNCRSCGAAVVWLLSAQGNRLIMDAEPCLTGNTVVRDGIGVVLRKDEIPEPGELRYRSHWSTCPDAPAWRHKARKRQ